MESQGKQAIAAIGLMSGTSMDGIDVAGVITDGEDFAERGPSHFAPYNAEFVQRLTAALEIAKSIKTRAERPGDLAKLERELTLRHADAVRDFLAGPGRDWAKPEVIGFHGQTVLHRPLAGLTVQLGDGPLLASQTGIAVVHDMRANDMVHGGQGAPLVPAWHAALVKPLGPAKFPVAVVNIGGIANVTYVPQHGAPIAFDCGPGNALIDQFVALKSGMAYDSGGATGMNGHADDAVFARYLEQPFFAKSGPKSLDRNDFTLDLARGLTLADGARTLAAVTARAILLSADAMPAPPATWIISGGGRKNAAIMAELRAGAGKADVQDSDALGFDGDAMEAEAWAYLAVRSLKGQPLTWPGTTGCREAVTGGVLSRP